MKFNLSEKYNPGNNFYLYVNDNWINSTVLPDEEKRWGSFNILAESNMDKIKLLLEENLNSSDNEIRMVTTLYNQAMDDSKDKIPPKIVVKDFLREIKEIKTKEELQDFIYTYFFMSGLSMPINFSSYNDLNDSDMNILHISSGGLGLPDRDYYLEEAKKEYLEKYSQFLKEYSELFELSLDIDGIVNLEKELAKSTYTNVEKRNPELMDNVTDFDTFSKNYKEMRLDKIFSLFKLSTEQRKINITNPKFLKNGINGFIELWNSLSLELWKDYFTISYLKQIGSFINLQTEEKLFDFYSKYLSGTKEMKPLWKRSISKSESLLGMIVGKLYVKQYFSTESKDKVLQMIQFIKDILKFRITNSKWMTRETIEKALEKLSKINFKIGYPDEWRDFTNLNVSPEQSFLENVLNCLKFENDFDFNQLYKPTDKSLWFMDPHNVNAYYSPSYNEIVFPAGILQDPFFSIDNDIGMNLGGIGAVISHEITHGFDDQGRKYDGEGNLNDWWNDMDDSNYKKQTDKLIKLFSSYTVEGKNINGDLTLGENIADLGGVTIAYDALNKYLKDYPNENIIIDKLTLQKRLFINYANIWKSKSRKEDVIQRLQTDPHSPPQYRVNGILIHVPGFYEVFNIKPTDRLYLEDSERTIIF
jgi:putative endopeptidase